uniref:Uncharacterized protein n=1 Tax=Haemonchus contortus TaxID=6289 RepID=A0A7I4YZQ3_HAECO
MSKVLLIEPDWQHKDKEVPEKFVAKIVTQLAMHKISAKVSEQANVKNIFHNLEFRACLEKLQKKCHNAEVTVYNHLLKLPRGKIDILEIYYMKKFTESNPLKGYIIMEYIENMVSVHIYEVLTPAQVKQILRNKAVLEATSLNFTPDEKGQLTISPFRELFAEFFSKELMDTMLTVFRKFEGGKFEEKAVRLEKILPDLGDLPRADSLSEECADLKSTVIERRTPS